MDGSLKPRTYKKKDIFFFRYDKQTNRKDTLELVRPAHLAQTN